ncbi:MAG TPA: 3-deoxy-manno-octulosonate cytidylyltransferase [Pyrinomonadaceae bacterium]|nr:3-deoxy-manno-octulosonate cytidylyltransferase [Pyrinomonadaceae bacterium]
MIHTGSNPPNNPKSKAVAIIPARYASVRLPGKALLEIAGKPMICWVAERALAARNVSGVIVATDDQRIFDALRNSGFEAVMTSANHASGTDRIAEVAETLGDADIIVNVQGDEPTISPETIDAAVAALIRDPECGIATTWEPIESVADVLSPDVVKMVVDEDDRAVYFSRSPVPYPRDAVRQHGSLQQALENDASVLARFRKHTGLYVYRREVLLAMARWPQSELEVTESLEQLRALEHGVKIKAIKASTASIGVDTAEDLERVRAQVAGGRSRRQEQRNASC